MKPVDPVTKAVVPPVHFSTIFAMDVPSSDNGFQYGRVGNPTRLQLEKTIARLHIAKHACAFSSGSAAIASVLSILHAGDHVICHKFVYEGTQRLLTNVFAQFGIRSSFIDLTGTDNLIKSILHETKLVVIESPTNPLLEVLNIKKLAVKAHSRGVLLAVDNTFLTPIIQKPLSLGADIVIESLTKGINGHSDAIGGALIMNDSTLFSRIKSLQITLGSILSPFDCYLILRGIKTLELRVRAQEKNARRIAHWLKFQPGVARVLFPGIGSMISFNINPAIVSHSLFLSRLKLITIAHSLGGTETLIQQPTIMMNLTLPKKILEEKGITDNFFRLSIGLEDPSAIIADLKQALATEI